jgi:hypothetical protein
MLKSNSSSSQQHEQRQNAHAASWAAANRHKLVQADAGDSIV